MKTLADSLYFKNLDNNTGVFHRLIDAAEEEEGKEAILAYYFLLRSKEALTVAELDQSIEQWFQQEYQHSLDFEVEDAIRKLEELNLIQITGHHITAISLKKARAKLDNIWDDYFDFN